MALHLRWLFGNLPLRVLLGCNIAGFIGIFYLLLSSPAQVMPVGEAARESEPAFQPIDRRRTHNLKPFTDKPLFHASRTKRDLQRQEVRAAEPEPVALPPSKIYRLSGVMGGNVAYVVKPGSGETIRLKVGDILEDWTVSGIGRDQLTLSQGDAVDQLTMDK